MTRWTIAVLVLVAFAMWPAIGSAELPYALPPHSGTIKVTLPPGLFACGADSPASAEKGKPFFRVREAGAKPGATFEVRVDTDAKCDAPTVETVHFVGVALLPEDIAQVELERNAKTELRVRSSALATRTTLRDATEIELVAGNAKLPLSDATCSGDACTFAVADPKGALAGSGRVALRLTAKLPSGTLSPATGDPLQPESKPIAIWRFSALTAPAQLVLTREQLRQTSPQIELDAPYAFLISPGTHLCKDHGECATLMPADADRALPVFRIEATPAVVSTLSSSKSIMVTAKLRSAVQVAFGDRDPSGELILPLRLDDCAYSLEQMTRVAAGLRNAEVVLRISTQKGRCSAPAWRVESKTKEIELRPELRRVGVADGPELYVATILSSPARPTAQHVELTFAYPDGTTANVAGATVALDATPKFGPPEVEVPVTRAAQSEWGSVGEKPAVMRGRSNRLRMGTLAGDGWSLRVPDGQAAKACDKEPFCVRVLERADGDLRVDFQRSAPASDVAISDEAKPALQKLAKLNLGTTPDALTLPIKDYRLAIDLTHRVAFKCGHETKDLMNGRVQAATTKALEQCNLLISLDGDPADRAGLANACTKRQARGVNADAFVNAFYDRWGQQDLKVEISVQDSAGEFKPKVGADPSSISIRRDRVYGVKNYAVQNGVLAVCVDLTHPNEPDSYQITKISVSHENPAAYLGHDTSVPKSSFDARRRKMPLIAGKPVDARNGFRGYMSTTFPAVIRIPNSGVTASTSSEFRGLERPSIHFGMLFGGEVWNFDDNKPWIPIFNPQLQLGFLLLKLPNQEDPKVLFPSFFAGLGLRLPLASGTTSAIESFSGLTAWWEVTVSGRNRAVNTFLLGLNISIGTLGS